MLAKNTTPLVVAVLLRDIRAVGRMQDEVGVHPFITADVRLRVKKGQREHIKAYAESKGFSLNPYIVHLIESDMGCSLLRIAE